MLLSFDANQACSWNGQQRPLTVSLEARRYDPGPCICGAWAPDIPARRGRRRRLHAEVEVGVGDLAQGDHEGGRAVVVDRVVAVEGLADLVVGLPHGVVQA